MFDWVRSLASAALGKVPGKKGRIDTATRMAMDADFRDCAEHKTSPCEPPQEIDQIEELERILREGK